MRVTSLVDFNHFFHNQVVPFYGLTSERVANGSGNQKEEYDL